MEKRQGAISFLTATSRALHSTPESCPCCNQSANFTRHTRLLPVPAPTPPWEYGSNYRTPRRHLAAWTSTASSYFVRSLGGLRVLPNWTATQPFNSAG